MVWRVLRRETCQPWTGINHKRVQRLWREEWPDPLRLVHLI